MEDLESLLGKIRQSKNNDDTNSADDAEIAFTALCSEYKSLIDNAVRRFAPSFGIGIGTSSELYGADDLRQYAVLALYKAAATYDPDDKGKNVSFGLYAKICINNALISQLRKYKTELKRREAVKKVRRTAKRSEASDPLHHLAGEEGAAMLIAKISAVLSDYEKEIFDLYIDGKSVREIAERLGKEEKSVSNALYRMKVKVRGLLKIQ